ncbi:hypothetical protein BDY21DRAFT_424307 [Lineolata rhizophorae]|uniref:Uncharacterized protein n=1 Tax=Lineolata rhizophorae TaxID=578093 RepID=A0A6A6NP78_9PEZI|nr:hypothetical protein BDY21DRAFT_424307 [Lineolata rhizophorae]
MTELGLIEPSESVQHDLERGSFQSMTIRPSSPPERQSQTWNTSAVPKFGRRGTWLGNVDQDHSVEVFERSDSDNAWKRVSSDGRLPMDPGACSDLGLSRIYLVEGVSIRTPLDFPAVSHRFWELHLQNILESDQAIPDSFHFKSFRRVYQSKENYDIEEKLRRGKPYDLTITTDPRHVRLNHVRFERPYGPHRPYEPLETISMLEDDALIRRCLSESISCTFWRIGRSLSKRVVGIIVFDPPQTLGKVEFTYTGRNKTEKQGPITYVDKFTDFDPSRLRFIDALERDPKSFASTIDGCIHDILRLIRADCGDVLSDYRETLDCIDDNMHDDVIIRDSLQEWRYLFGRWRKKLSNELKSLTRAIEELELASSMQVATGVGSQNHDIITPLRSLAKELQRLALRTDSTFTAIMSTMGIIESQKAILQAETITKLTHLAFFFIPLAFCSSVFGMNINEWENQLSVWTWIVASLTLCVCTYGALYFHEIKLSLAQRPQRTRIRNPNTVSHRLNTFTAFLAYYSRSAFGGITGPTGVIILSCVAIIAWAVGIWAIVTQVHMPTVQIVFIALGYAVGLPYLVSIWIYLCMRRAVSARHLVAIFGFILCDGVGVYVVMLYMPVPYGGKVSLAVGLAVGLPCLVSTWIWAWARSLHFGKRWWTCLAVLVTALVPSCWAVVTQLDIDFSASISIALALGLTLPTVLGILAGLHE